MYSDWISHNLESIVVDRKQDFHVHMVWDSFPVQGLRTATESVIDSYHSFGNVYIGLSGGMDSEYIANSFLEYGKRFTPVIVEHKCNRLETEYAYKFCNTYGLKPVVWRLSTDDFFRINLSVYKLMGTNKSPGTAPTIFMKEKLSSGILLNGNQFMGDGADDPRNFYFEDHNFVHDFFDGIDVDLFFLSNKSIAYALLSRIENDDHRVDYFKHRVYGINYRPKIRMTDSLEYRILEPLLLKLSTPVHRKEQFYIDYRYIMERFRTYGKG